MADCVSNKIDSNVTGLAFAEEVCPRQLPTLADDGYDPKWYDLEPNEYGDFGGEITTLARRPLNKNRRNKKGTPVDLDATAEFTQDFTLHNSNRLLQGFFFSNFREKPTTLPYNDDQIVITGVTAANDRYAAASGMLQFVLGGLVLVSGSSVPANNGLKLIDEVTDTYIGVGDGTVNEAAPPSTLVISQVGYQFNANELSVALSGALAVLTIATAPVAAEGVMTIEATFNAAEGDTVTIGSTVYTFTTTPADPYEVLIGASRVSSAENLRKAINGDLLGTPAHTVFTATDDGAGAVTVTAIYTGVGGNGYALLEDGDHLSWDVSASAGGTGMSFPGLGLTVGEWVYVGGDGALLAFANNIGYARISAMTDTTLTFDKTTWTPVAEAAPASSTIQLFFGSSLRDEDYDEQVTRTFQFERTLGRGGTEYVRGAIGNELVLNFDTADKFTVELNHMAADTQRRTNAQGVKDGDRFASFGEDAYNTSNDVVRMAMTVIDPASSVPGTLFTWVTEGNLTINNNASAVKAIGALGGIDVSVGNFDVSGEVTALFTSVEAIDAVQNNDDVTYDFIVAKGNAGFIYDIPLLSLGNGMPEIEENEPITLPLGINGAENPNSYTMLYMLFEYLPDVAMPEVVEIA